MSGFEISPQADEGEIKQRLEYLAPGITRYLTAQRIYPIISDPQSDKICIEDCINESRKKQNPTMGYTDKYPSEIRIGISIYHICNSIRKPITEIMCQFEDDYNLCGNYDSCIHLTYNAELNILSIDGFFPTCYTSLGYGVGRKILKTIERYAKARKVKEIQIKGVVQSAIQFYERCGYVKNTRGIHHKALKLV